MTRPKKKKTTQVKFQNRHRTLNFTSGSSATRHVCTKRKAWAQKGHPCLEWFSRGIHTLRLSEWILKASPPPLGIAVHVLLDKLKVTNLPWESPDKLLWGVSCWRLLVTVAFRREHVLRDPGNLRSQREGLSWKGVVCLGIATLLSG